MITKFRTCLLAIFLLLIFIPAVGQTLDKDGLPLKPEPPRLVNDYTGSFLTADEAERLERKLEQFSNETSNQIAVVIVNDIGNFEPIDYATRLGEKWGVGKGKFDNGIVVLVQPNTRDLTIAVGYGLEGAIPDLATKRIREEEMNPHFKEGRYYEGLEAGTNKLMQLAKGEISVKDYTARKQGKERFPTWIIVIILLFIFFFLRRGGRGRRGGAFWGGFGSGYTIGRGGWSSGGSFGGSSSWGGFGGGSFGGGGSSGKW